MRYMLVNVGSSNLQINLLHPEPSYNKTNLHRPGPIMAINLPRGGSIDILPHFNGSIEEAHKCVTYSRDVLKALYTPGLLSIYVCDDNNNQVDVDALLGIGVTEEQLEEVTSSKQNEVEGKAEEIIKGKKDKEKEIDKAIEENDFTAIPGVGGPTNEKLTKAGYKTYKDLAEADVSGLKKVVGFYAEEIVKNAKKMLKN